MGGKSEKGENIDWSAQSTKVLIEKNYDRVKKGHLQGSTFKTNIWEEINNELKAITGENYGVDRLKGKFNRLHPQHREFSTLLSRTRVTWNSESNKVNAPDDIWEDLYKQGRFYKNFRKHGFEHDYDILGEIFNSSTATGKLHQASSQEPPTSNEEREMEATFLSKGVHIDLDDVGDSTQELDKKRKTESSSSECQHKGAKISRSDKLEARFPILKMMPNYPIKRQRLIPIACCTIHNFIRMQHMQHDTDRLFSQCDGDDLIVDEGLRVDQEGVNVDVNQSIEMAQVREAIANQMWESYRRS